MISTAGIIIIGDEILSGRTKDTNINWIASELNNVGIRLIEARIIADDMDTIVKTIQKFSKKAYKSLKRYDRSLQDSENNACTHKTRLHPRQANTPKRRKSAINPTKEKRTRTSSK